jgi:hypothetical protein
MMCLTSISCSDRNAEGITTRPPGRTGFDRNGRGTGYRSGTVVLTQLGVLQELEAVLRGEGAPARKSSQGDGVSAARTSDPTTVTAGASMRVTRHLATSTPERAATMVTATIPAVAISSHAWKK